MRLIKLIGVLLFIFYPVSVSAQTLFVKTKLVEAEVNFWSNHAKQGISIKSAKQLWNGYQKHLKYKGSPSESEFVEFFADDYEKRRKKFLGADVNFLFCESLTEARLFYNTYGRKSSPVMSYISEPEVSEESLIKLRKNAWDVYNKSQYHFQKMRGFLESSTQCIDDSSKRCSPKDLEYAVTFIPQSQLIYHQARGQGLPAPMALCYALIPSVQSKQLYYHRLNQPKGFKYNFYKPMTSISK